MAHEKIIQAIFEALDEVNSQLPPDRRVAKTLGTALYGHSGELDSLGLMNFIVALEQIVDREFGVTINLADDDVLAQAESPLNTVRSLTNYIASLTSRS